MKVQKVTINNFKSIEDLNIDLDGRSVYLVGRNRSGKSSLIQAIYSALSGQEIPETAITQGQSKGHIEVSIGDADKKYNIKLAFTEKNQKGYLTITTPDGMKANSKKVLDDIVGNITFDPFDFIRSDGKTQVKFIKELSGINFDDMDNQRKELYDERTIQNRLLKEKESVLKSIPEVELPDDTERQDQTEINTDIENAIDYNNKIGRAEEKLSELKDNLNDISEQIKRLEEKKKEISDRIIDGAKYLDEHKLINIDDLKIKFNKITETNQLLDEYDKREEVVYELDKIKDLSNDLSAQIEEIDLKKQAALDNTSLPVPGLGFDDDGLLLDGLRFSDDQIAKSTIIETGIKLSMALNPNVRIIRIKDGSLLDKESMAAVLAYIKANDYQGFIEIVDRDVDQLKIEYVEDM